MSDELVRKADIVAPFRPGAMKTGLAARKAAEQAKIPESERVKQPEEMEHRLGIIYDDSVSMSTKQNTDAIEGVEEFLRSCKAGETAVAIQPLNRAGLRLNTNLPAVAIFTKGMYPSGGTPLVQKLLEMLNENSLTRAIVFSDGVPNSHPESLYGNVVEKKIPVDTVYIPAGRIDYYAVEFMKKLAANTGGLYLQLESGKSNFRTAFKYLSPGLRYMLADKSFVEKLEGR